MIIRLPTRIRVHHAGFGRRVDPSDGTLIDLARHQETRRSEGFPRATQRRLQLNQFAGGSAEMEALIAPQCGSRGALLMRPIIAVAEEDTPRFCGMALQRIRIIAEPPHCASPRRFAECGSLVFGAADWHRHAPSIVRHVVADYVPEPTRSDLADAFALPRLIFDFPRDNPASVGEISPASLAILDALARGQRAVFGSESFASDHQFLHACAHAIALLPAGLRGNLSIAAGFTKPLPDALIQWVGAVMSSPPSPGALAATIAGLPLDTPLDEARITRAEMIKPMAWGEIGDDPLDDDTFQHKALERLRAALGVTAAPAAEETADPFMRLTTVLERVASGRTAPLGSEAARQAVRAVDACFFEPGRTEIPQHFATSRWGQTICRLRDGHTLPSANPVEVAQSLADIEAMLAGVAAIADAMRWTEGLELMSKAAIAALRAVIIDKPHADANIGAAFLLSLARIPNSLHVVAELIGAGDRPVRSGVEYALMATALLSGEIDEVRPGLIGELLSSSPAEDFLPPSAHALALPGVA